MSVKPIPLLDMDLQEIEALCAEWNQPRYRALQLWEWIYEHLAVDPVAMSNLPRALRQQLATDTTLEPLALLAEQRSEDRQTIKWLFGLRDGHTIETVLMLYEERRTVCISSQAGCAMGCVFCATGQAGLARNLTAGEITGQVLAAARWAMAPPPEAHVAPGPITNVVVMGMGEPLANYERTWKALRILNHRDGFNLGARHMTLSTVGLPDGIRRMAKEPMQVNLAVSLHAPDDDLRTSLVPVNHRYPIAEVMEATREYAARTGRRVTFEYALMDQINDGPEQAQALAGLVRGLICHVNLIPLNPVVESPYKPSPPARAAAFLEVLERTGIPVTMRVRRGIDIDAGCGQLRRRVAGWQAPVAGL